MRVVLFASALLLMVLSGCLSGEPKVEATDEDSGASCTGSANATSASITCSSGSKSASKSGSASSTSTTGPGSGNGTGNATVNTAPVIQSFTGNVTGLSVSFLINASDADGDALTYVLAFGDNSTNATGTLANGVGNATHTFAAGGSFNATLVVSDGSAQATKSLQVTVTAPSAAEVDHRECTGRFGTNPVGLTINSGANSVGGCSLGSITIDMVVTALDAVSGCVHDVSPSGSSSGYGTSNSVGSKWPAGAAFRIVCDVGTITLSGSMDLVPA
ncbi:MAG: PKD domain-containing protein [Candidatus Thermoplasmatota archaeon]